jgi:hypothetical protein
MTPSPGLDNKSVYLSVLQSIACVADAGLQID